MRKGTKVVLPNGRTGKVTEVESGDVRDVAHVQVEGRRRPATVVLHRLVPASEAA